MVDGSLKDEDIAQAGGTFYDFDANIGTVFARTCKLGSVTGVGANSDHLLLTPTANEHNYLSYTAENDIAGAIWIKACNPTNSDIDDATTGFNLLVIDAQ